MPQLPFFMTRKDLTTFLKAVEERVAVAYSRTGSFSTARVERFNSGLEIPELGTATADSSVACESFLVTPRGMETKLRTVGAYTLVDQLANPGSIVITPGGVHRSGALVPGRVSTVHEDSTAKELLGAFRLELRRQTKKVKAFHLGAEAERLWVRIFHDDRNLIDSARLVSGTLSGSIASG